MSRYKLPLKAGQAATQTFSGKCVMLAEPGAADKIGVTLLVGTAKTPAPLGDVPRNFSVYSPSVVFTGAEFLSAVDTTIEVVVTDFELRALDGANFTVTLKPDARQSVQVRSLLTNAIATGAGASAAGYACTKTYDAQGTTTAGAGSATVVVEGSNDGTTWSPIDTILLTLGTTSSSDGFTSDDRYAFVRANVTAISGTGAKVSLVESR
jgi:CheY-like chemotaxis protein